MRWMIRAMSVVLVLAATGLQAGPSGSSNIGVGLAVPFRITPAPSAGLGLSGKVWMDNVHAVDAEVFGGNGWLSVGGDYLWHRYGVFSGSAGKRLPLYYGPGASLTMWSAGPYSGTALGAQGKLGVDYLFVEPFDLYFELVPQLMIVPSVNFGVGTTLGGRFYF